MLLAVLPSVCVFPSGVCATTTLLSKQITIKEKQAVLFLLIIVNHLLGVKNNIIIDVMTNFNLGK